MDRLPTPVFLDFPGDLDNKESACKVGDLGSISGLVRSPGGGHGNPLQNSCLENLHGQRSLAGYHPWGCSQAQLSSSAHRQNHCSKKGGRMGRRVNTKI